MLSKAIRAMPSPNRECLGFVVSFMRDIARFKKHNRMGVSNVVTCFAFCLMERKISCCLFEKMSHMLLCSGKGG